MFFFGGGLFTTLQGRDFMRHKIDYSSLRTDFSAAWYIGAFGNPSFLFKIKCKQFILSTDRKNYTKKEGKRKINKKKQKVEDSKEKKKYT